MATNASFTNSGLLRSKYYNAEEFGAIALNSTYSLGPCPDALPDDNAEQPTSTPISGHTYWVYGAYNTQASEKIGQFRIKCYTKDDTLRCKLIFRPNLVSIINNIYYVYNNPDYEIEIADFAADANVTFELKPMHANEAGDIEFADSQGRPGYYTLAMGECSFNHGVGFLTGYNTTVTKLFNSPKLNCRIKYSNEQPYAPDNNTIWMYPIKE